MSEILPAEKQTPSLTFRVIRGVIFGLLGFLVLNNLMPIIQKEVSDSQISQYTGLNTLFSLLPIMMGAGILGTTFLSIIGYSEDTEEEAAADDYWVNYGQRLKLAYTSKFGGENAGFNDEVDQRVLIMQNNGRGITRAIAKDWLNRMHRFTEAK